MYGSDIIPILYKNHSSKVFLSTKRDDDSQCGDAGRIAGTKKEAFDELSKLEDEKNVPCLCQLG